MRKYETIFVIDSLLKSEEIDSIINKYERFISANGGSIETIKRWGKKRLAYEIKKRQYGYYVLIRFDGPPTMIRQLEREYRLNESLLRYKTLLLSVPALKAMEASGELVKDYQVEKKEEQPEKENIPVPAEEETGVTEPTPEETPAPEAESSEEPADAEKADEEKAGEEADEEEAKE